jgi:MFS family permease
VKGSVFVENEKKFRLDYSWVIIGICFLMVFACLGLCSSGRTYYLTAITDALDIPRGLFSLNNTVRFITTTILNLFFGKLIMRFGAKKLISAGLVSLIIFAVINATADKLYQFYIGGFFLGVGLAWTTTTMVSFVINKWATKNKATLTGAVLAANGIGGAIAVQIIVPIIFQEGNPFGYRDSYFLVAKILAVLLLLSFCKYFA